MESYRELRDRQQKEFNELPLGFVFSDKQFDEMMENGDLTRRKTWIRFIGFRAVDSSRRKITSISMRYWTGTTLRWRRQRRPMKMEQDFFTRCSSTNWIITSTDIPEILKILWIAWD